MRDFMGKFIRYYRLEVGTTSSAAGKRALIVTYILDSHVCVDQYMALYNAYMLVTCAYREIYQSRVLLAPMFIFRSDPGCSVYAN